MEGKTQYAVRPFFNVSAPFEPYVLGATEVEPSLTQHTFTCSGPEQAASQAFVYFNSDERKNGADERSVSVGDCLVVSSLWADWVFAVEPVGMTLIDVSGDTACTDGPICPGHESTDGAIGNVTYCDGTCRQPSAPRRAL